MILKELYFQTHHQLSLTETGTHYKKKKDFEPPKPTSREQATKMTVENTD